MPFLYQSWATFTKMSCLISTVFYVLPLQQCFTRPNLTLFLLIPFLNKHLHIMLCTADQKSWLWSIFASVHMVLQVMSCHCSSAWAGHFRVSEVIHLRTLAVFFVFVHFCPQPMQVIILRATLDGGHRCVYEKKTTSAAQRVGERDVWGGPEHFLRVKLIVIFQSNLPELLQYWYLLGMSRLICWKSIFLRQGG